jgi:hypothetical protein
MSSGWFLGFRFLNFYQYVLDHVEIDYFVFADAFDVEVAANPFPAMITDGCDLFVQEVWRLLEWPKPLHDGLFCGVQPRCQGGCLV